MRSIDKIRTALAWGMSPAGVIRASVTTSLIVTALLGLMAMGPTS